MHWKVIAASARGTSHELNDQPCQDTHAVFHRDDWFIGVASDGAGSARFAEHGSRHASASIVDHLSRCIGKRAPGQGWMPDAWQADVREAIQSARDSVLAGLPGETRLSDCNATLVGCVANAQGGLFFHIGDGAAVALESSTLAAQAVSQPENGEFAEQTFFYTLDDWPEHLRFTGIAADCDLIALMSDGTASFCLARGNAEIDRRFFAPVTQYLSQESIDQESGSEALMSTLASPGACRVTSDDKTLIWARRYRA